MTNLERLKATLGELAIPFTEQKSTFSSDPALKDTVTEVSIAEGYGYPGFCAAFHFNKDGVCLGHSVYE